jgi:uncharacterized membrane protein YcfT
MSGNANRLDWVDTAKGLSIILVVMMHSAYGVGDDTGHIGYLNYIIAWATPFRMPEFFLISGLFLSQVIARPWGHYADRRIVHYFYFYALWAVLQIAFKVGLGAGDVGSAVASIGLAVVEPYGVLWFIYMLAVLSFAAKILYMFKVPHWAALAGAAALQIAPVATGIHILDYLAEFFVYFYAGYALAPQLFRIVARAQRHAAVAIAGLLAFAVINGLLVFAGGSELHPVGMQMGYAALPGLHLLLAFAGALAVCITAALLAMLPVMNWLRWLGAHSIVVYLSFAIPMAASRVLLLKLGVIENGNVLGTIVFLTALIAPLILYWLIQKTGFGKFLFERPAWAHLPGTPGSRGYVAKPAAAPAE